MTRHKRHYHWHWVVAAPGATLVYWRSLALLEQLALAWVQGPGRVPGLGEGSPGLAGQAPQDHSAPLLLTHREHGCQTSHSSYSGENSDSGDNIYNYIYNDNHVYTQSESFCVAAGPEDSGSTAKRSTNWFPSQTVILLGAWPSLNLFTANQRCTRTAQSCCIIPVI